MIKGDRDDLEGQDQMETETGQGSMAGVKVNDAQFSLILVIAVSLVLLIAVLTFEGGIKSRGYVISVPALSLSIALVALLLTVVKENIYKLYGQYIVYFLYVWNFTGASFMTFGDPFDKTGNGYFAAWGLVVVTGRALGFTKDSLLSRLQGYGWLQGLGFCSAIVFIALLGDKIGGPSIYAMIVVIFTVLFVVGIMFLETKHAETTKTQMFLRVQFGLLALFSVLWFILAFLTTFKEPFTTTGNGYFASWIGMVCAFFSTFSAWKELGISTAEVVGFLTPRSNSSTGLSATVT